MRRAPRPVRRFDAPQDRAGGEPPDERGRRDRDPEPADGMRRRDERDANRAVGPLVRPDGAVDVDTSSLSFDESIDKLESIVRTHAPEASLACASSQRGHG